MNFRGGEVFGSMSIYIHYFFLSHILYRKENPYVPFFCPVSSTNLTLSFHELAKAFIDDRL